MVLTFLQNIALTTSCIAILYQVLVEGGSGYLAGILSIIEAAIVGVAFNLRRKHRSKPFSRVEILLIAFRAELQNGKIIYRVEDDGVGFDLRYADKLFIPFQRLHAPKDYDGSGVGLSIVKRIVERHGGRIWAESEPDRGARFSFTLDGQARNE